MNQSTTFRINSPTVVQETIDGEVVIVHLEKGDYYSLLNSGADIWNGIERGLARDKIIKEMVERYEGSREDIEKGVTTLIEQLQQEELIIVDNVHSSNGTAKSNAPTINTSGEKPNFEPPALGKYTDMEELLALDPIHDVDEMGWPNAKAEVF
ncbi:MULTISPECIES: PqqD family protein [unclassified Coleofasciculus]|uniref:PqqD family protein n=1 Tax=unclassified Coleofasciculus TaxID=2692782 RepID=UPI0018828A73|nr:MULTISPECIES: PqqD family protein [unclassified Coleofasciculus]MBE9125521.1 PqqD family protein [Coleofasciculus sp. LEGE 07081]MBE9148615.1 PqqD family protein [Coleofasciculus sp. LEGE 07092]